MAEIKFLHHCDFPSPTIQQAADAIKNILADVRGEDVDLLCSLHCGGVVYLYGLKVLGHDHEPLPVYGEERKAAAIAEMEKVVKVSDVLPATTQSLGIDWKLIAVFVWQWVKPKIDEWLNS